MASHINSTARDSLNGSTPFDLADLLIGKRIPALTGQHKVSPDNVLLKPALLEKGVFPKNKLSKSPLSPFFMVQTEFTFSFDPYNPVKTLKKAVHRFLEILVDQHDPIAGSTKTLREVAVALLQFLLRVVPLSHPGLDRRLVKEDIIEMRIDILFRHGQANEFDVLQILRLEVLPPVRRNVASFDDEVLLILDGGLTISRTMGHRYSVNASSSIGVSVVFPLRINPIFRWSIER